MLKLLGIILILWELLAEHIKPIVQNRFGKVGLSIFSAVLFYNRLREKAEIRSMAKRLSALEEGERWNGTTRKSCVTVQMNLRRLYRLLLPAADRGRKGRRRMQIDTKSIRWSTLIPALVCAVKLALQTFGIEISVQEVNDWLNVLSAVIAPLGVALSHRKVNIPPEVTEAIQQSPKTYSDMVPIMNEVNNEINAMLQQIKSGKYTDATQDAINAYQKIHAMLKKGA